MDGNTFQEKQKKLLEKQAKEKNLEIKREKEWNDKMEDGIVSFFEENKETIINKTLDSFMKKLDNKKRPPYEVEYEFDTSLYFGFTRSSYEVLLEEMIKKELKKSSNAIGRFEVNVAGFSRENGYYSGPSWVPTGGRHHVIGISIYLYF